MLAVRRRDWNRPNPDGAAVARSTVFRFSLSRDVNWRSVLCVLARGGSEMSLLYFLVVGLVAGWLAGVLVKGGGFGLIGDLVVGVIGAVLGGWLFSTLGASAGGGLLGSIVVATIGAVVLLVIVRLIKRA
jgi:uncharacterized membrane protein YeaQ/YmgE (transglycosylase-associated protein family)